MKRERMRRMVVTAAVFAAVVAYATRADARVRVTANVIVPGVSIYAGNVPSCCHEVRYYRRVPPRGRVFFETTRKERRIARRLAWFSGVPARELIRLRMSGFGWFEIGRIIRVPRPVVRAAMHRRSWNRLVAGGWMRPRTRGRRGRGAKGRDMFGGDCGAGIYAGR